jgi:hypothetical protein
MGRNCHFAEFALCNISTLKLTFVYMVLHDWRSGEYLHLWLSRCAFEASSKQFLNLFCTTNHQAQETWVRFPVRLHCLSVYFQPVQCLSVYFNKYLKLIPKPTDRGQEMGLVPQARVSQVGFL